MACEGFFTLDFKEESKLKTLYCAAVGFHFWHGRNGFMVGLKPAKIAELLK